jgi:organic radical activating enzyme
MPFQKETHIPVMEHFYTLQGEGFYTGHAAYFIRLSGCDVGCVWCDVKESWPVSSKQNQKISGLVKAIRKTPAKLVVITGGEPLMYDLEYLTRALKKAGLQVNIETSGAYPLSGTLDWICISPKKFKAPLPEVLKKAHELKVIVYHRSDFQFAEKNRLYTHSNCRLYLQPEWSKATSMLPLILDYIKSHPDWNLSLQTHKYLGIP